MVKNTTWFWISICIFLGPEQHAVAQSIPKDMPDHYALMYGSGKKSCGTYSLAFQTDTFNSGVRNPQGRFYASPGAMISEWISGYISAVNTHMPTERQTSVDMAGITLWIKRYCDSNPTSTILNAVNNFLFAQGYSKQDVFREFAQ
jgi:hypothetical protein